MSNPQAWLVLPSTKPTLRIFRLSFVAMSAFLVFSFLVESVSPGAAEKIRGALGPLPWLAFLGGAAWYATSTSRAMRTRKRSISLAVDARGVFVDGVLVAPLERIRVATIRLPREASVEGNGPGPSLIVDAYPLTVEISTDEQTWNFEVGGMERCAALLEALGFSPTTIPWVHPRPPTREVQDMQRAFLKPQLLYFAIALVLMIVMQLFGSFRR